MLNKLIKYEINATGRKLIPLYIALIVFALINKINFNSSFDFYNNMFKIGNIINVDVSSLVKTFFMGAYIVTVVGIIVATTFVVIQRFYKNLFGSEGYLMNTIPVKPSENILSKLIVGVMWSAIGFIVSVISFVIIIYRKDMFNLYIYEDIIKITKYVLSGKPMVYVASFTLSLLTQSICSILEIYASISIGQLSNKHKIITSFGAYLGISLVINSIVSFLSILFFSVINISESLTGINLVFLGIIIFGIIVNILTSIPCYLISKYILQNKLNLE